MRRLFLCAFCAGGSPLQWDTANMCDIPYLNERCPTTAIEVTGRGDSHERASSLTGRQGCVRRGFVEACGTSTSICPPYLRSRTENISCEGGSCSVAVGTPTLIAVLQRLSVAPTEMGTLRLLPLCLLR